MSCTFSVFVIGPPCDCGLPIVSVTGICTSCEMPPSWIVTLKSRLELVVTVFSVPWRQHLRGAAGAVREGGDRDDVRSVQAARRARAGRAADAVEHERHRVLGDDQVGVRQEVRFGHVDLVDAVGLDLLVGRHHEEVVPDDVAREQPVGLLGERGSLGAFLALRACSSS